MKKSYSLIMALAFLLTGNYGVDKIPQAEISNGLIRARIYLPDAVNGYYRGSRFDWSGVIPSLEYKTHSFFGQWFERYSPTMHDAIMGPVEDFLPVGYDKTKTGESFLKIGIGMLIKPAEPAYSIVTPYRIKNGGEWKVKKKSDRVEFIHTLLDDQYAYTYNKTVLLPKDKPVMELSHSLKNTGSRAIETDVYNHNFFWMDQQMVGPSYTIEFPFQPSGESEAPGKTGKLEGKKILFLKELERNEHLYYQSLRGYGNTAADYDIKIENHKTGAAVRIKGDRPLSKMVFWSARKTVCPEPYTRISIKPGETFQWKIYYQFYICDTLNQQSYNEEHADPINRRAFDTGKLQG